MITIYNEQNKQEIRLTLDIPETDQLFADLQFVKSLGINCDKIFEKALRSEVKRYKDKALEILKKQGACYWSAT